MYSLNRESYNAIAPRWAAARSAFFGREREYLDLLVPGKECGASVLDLGCGTGRPLSEYLQSKGASIVGVDQSEKMLAMFSENLPSATAVCASIEEYVPAQKFSAAIGWDSIFHVRREFHALVFGRVFEALLPRGRFMLTLGGSAHPAFVDSMFEHDFFYDSHAPEMSRALLLSAGFEILLEEFMNVPTGSRDKGRIAYVVQKP